MRAAILILVAVAITFTGCHSGNKPVIANTSLDDIGNHQPSSLDIMNLDSIRCTDLSNKEVGLLIGNNELERDPGDSTSNIWNLRDLDTTNYFSVEDYFTNEHTKNRILLLHGNAGMSAGNANYLLLLLSCKPVVKVLWAGQVAPFTPNDIVDVNHDGIKEIIIHTNSMWQGEINEDYSIFNFRGNRRYFLYERQSLELDLENIITGEGPHAVAGDTLKEWYDCTLINNDNKYQIKQVKTLHICNGGSTDYDIEKLMKVMVDTTYINLSNIE